jgi:hypothetical protein
MVEPTLILDQAIEPSRMLKKSVSVRGRLRKRLMRFEARLATGSISRFHSLSAFSLEPPASNILLPPDLSLSLLDR